MDAAAAALLEVVAAGSIPCVCVRVPARVRAAIYMLIKGCPQSSPNAAATLANVYPFGWFRTPNTALQASDCTRSYLRTIVFFHFVKDGLGGFKRLIGRRLSVDLCM